MREMAVRTARVCRVLLPDGREEGYPSQATGDIPASVKMNDVLLPAAKDGDAR